MTRRSIFMGAGLMLASMVFAPARAGAPPSPTGKQEAAKTLSVGDPAPPLGGVRWIKGTRVDGFKPGQVYVVELWATWCGPCRLMMPHLSQLARAYKGKVTFLGVDVLEDGKDFNATSARVDAFVAEMGDQMDYNVCQDTEDTLVTRTWFRAAKLPGIPATFVVDGQGRIAWLGHPMHLEVVLPAVLKGAFDARQFEDKLAVLEKTQGTFGTAFKQGDYKAALKVAEGLPEGEPAFASSRSVMRLIALVHLDQEGAEKVYAEMERAGHANELLASILMAQEGIPNIWRVRAAGLVKQAAKRKQDLYNLAEVQFKAGLKAEAVETIKAFLAYLKDKSAKEPGKAAALATYIRKAQEALNTYEGGPQAAPGAGK